MSERTNVPQRADSRSGFTLVEVLFAITIFSIVVGGALHFFSVQMSAYTEGAGRARTVQNLQYATSQLGRNLRTVGTSIVGGQPHLVYASDDLIAFNADYVTSVAGDPFAVYYDPDAPAGEVSSLASTQSVTLPGTSFTYPDTTYLAGTQLAPAELIVLYFSPDSTTSRTDDFALFRQVNQSTPERVAENILRLGDGPFFSYERLRKQSDGDIVVVAVPDSALPLGHSAPIHGSTADTGPSAALDSIRGVEVRLRSTNGRIGADEVIRALTTKTWLRNAGLASTRMCGSPPIFASAVTATVVDVDPDPAISVYAVRLVWSPATDETGGEKDVIRYVIWRRLSTEPMAAAPFLSVPAGSPSYVYEDRTVQPGQQYVYEVAAQDCTPSMSAAVIATVGPIPTS